jgi:hypothetical protein
MSMQVKLLLVVLFAIHSVTSQTSCSNNPKNGTWTYILNLYDDAKLGFRLVKQKVVLHFNKF